MRKLFVAAIAAALVIAGFAVMAIADNGEAGTSWTFSLKPNKVGKAASSSSLIVPAKVDDQGTADTSDDVYTPPEKSTINFPKDSVIDTAALQALQAHPE